MTSWPDHKVQRLQVSRPPDVLGKHVDPLVNFNSTILTPEADVAEVVRDKPDAVDAEIVVRDHPRQRVWFGLGLEVFVVDLPQLARNALELFLVVPQEVHQPDERVGVTLTFPDEPDLGLCDGLVGGLEGVGVGDFACAQLSQKVINFRVAFFSDRYCLSGTLPAEVLSPGSVR